MRQTKIVLEALMGHMASDLRLVNQLIARTEDPGAAVNSPELLAHIDHTIRCHLQTLQELRAIAEYPVGPEGCGRD